MKKATISIEEVQKTFGLSSGNPMIIFYLKIKGQQKLRRVLSTVWETNFQAESDVKTAIKHITSVLSKGILNTANPQELLKKGLSPIRQMQLQNLEKKIKEKLSSESKFPNVIDVKFRLVTKY
jgi:hypothetical protein